MRHRKQIISFLLLLTTLSMVSLFSCTGYQPSPEETIASTRDAIAEIETYRVEITSVQTENGETTESSFLMEFVLPDHIQQTPLSDDGQIASIWIGNTEYRWDNDKDISHWINQIITPFNIVY